MYNVIFITCANKKEAKIIASALVKKRIAACVNIIDRIESIFWWEGKIDTAKEILLIVKSKKSELPRIIKITKSLHSYQTPEIISLPITNGYRPYLKWIDDSLR